jgi:hypothetical protein
MEGPATLLADRMVWMLGLGIAGGSALFLRGFALWRRRRTIEDTPTARVRSMSLGRVELSGVAREKDALRAPLSGTACVWFRYRIERETRSGKRRSWTTIDSGDSSQWPFYLEDETGRVRVEPEGATVEVDAQLRATDPPLVGPFAAFVAERGLRVHGLLGGQERLRITEARLHPGDAIYLHGVAQARRGVRDEQRLEIRARLAELKSDEKAMAALDADADGAVSTDEWDAARLRVVTDVESRRVEDGVHVARDPLGHAAFLVCAGSESAVLRSLGWRAAGSVFGGAILALACLGFLLARLGVIGGT